MAGTTRARQYVALTTTGPDGWFVVLLGEPGESRAAVEDRASRDICGDQWDRPKDISVDTQIKNLQVVSVSAARRAFRSAMRTYEAHMAYESVRG